MKVFLILIVTWFLFFSTSFSQDIECGTEVPAGAILEQAKSGDLNLYKRTTMTDSIRLAIHVVRYSDGTGGITQVDLDQKIIELDNFMAQANFQFYVYDTYYIDSDQWATVNSLAEADQLKGYNYIHGCVNIYFVPSFTMVTRSHRGKKCKRSSDTIGRLRKHSVSLVLPDSEAHPELITNEHFQSPERARLKEAGQSASRVYIYRFQSNDYVASRN
jgi:hypothetical protein